MEILKRAWTRETFWFHRQFYKFDNICRVPKPYQPINLAATERQAREEPHESIMFFYRYLGQRLKALRSKIIVGTPAMVVDRLSVLKETLGLSGILAEMNCGMRIPHDRVLNSLRLLCSQVMPRFRD